MTTLRYLLACAIALLAGCQSTLPIAPVPDSLTATTPAIEGAGQRIQVEARKVKVDAQTIQAATTQPAVVAPAKRIEASATVIDGEAGKIIGPLAEALRAAERERTQLEQRLVEETKRANAAEKERDDANASKFLGYATICGLVALGIIGLGLAIRDIRVVIGGIVGGAVSVTWLIVLAKLVAFVSTYWYWFALGIVAVIAGTVYMLWKAYRKGWLTNPHLVNPTEQLNEALTLAAKGRVLEAGAVLRTTAWGDAQYRDNAAFKAATQPKGAM